MTRPLSSLAFLLTLPPGVRLDAGVIEFDRIDFPAFHAWMTALGVTVAFTVEVFEANEEGERGTEVARIECRYAALFVCDLVPPAQPDEVDAFARTVGVMALYPYARAGIQDTTARMGLPALTMGIYRIPIDDPQPADG